MFLWFSGLLLAGYLRVFAMKIIIILTKIIKIIKRPQSLNDAGPWIQIVSIFRIIITPLFKIALNLRKEIQVSCTTIHLYN